MRRRLNARENERGAVLVLVAVLAPVIVALLIYVIDVGNWQEHKRHLQLQADAAALAAAQQFQPCDNSNIYATAGQYAGTTAVTTPSGQSVSSSAATPQGGPYNTQVGNTSPSNIHVMVNSKTYLQPAVDTRRQTTPRRLTRATPQWSTSRPPRPTCRGTSGR